MIIMIIIIDKNNDSKKNNAYIIYIYYYIVLSAYLCSVFRQAFQDYPIKFVQQITVPLCHHVHVLNGPVVTCSKYKSDEWSSFPCSMSFHVLPWIHVLLVFIEILHVHTCPASIDIQDTCSSFQAMIPWLWAHWVGSTRKASNRQWCEQRESD